MVSCAIAPIMIMLSMKSRPSRGSGVRTSWADRKARPDAGPGRPGCALAIA